MNNGVLSEVELHSRYEIYLEKYYKTINIEARTLLDILKKDILPANLRFENELVRLVINSKQLGIYDKDSYEAVTLNKVRSLKKHICKDISKMEKLLDNKPDESLKLSYFYHDRILPLMNSIRKYTDELETITDREYWPLPTYKELLFGVD